MRPGKRKRDRQPAMWVPTTDLPTAASHAFYTRLNQLLRQHGFDDFAEAQCATLYAETMGRPGLAPGIDLETHRAVFPWVLQCLSTAAPATAFVPPSSARSFGTPTC